MDNHSNWGFLDPIVINYYRDSGGRCCARLESATPLPYGWTDFIFERDGADSVVRLGDSGTEILRLSVTMGQLQRMFPRILGMCAMSYLAGDVDGRNE